MCISKHCDTEMIFINIDIINIFTHVVLDVSFVYQSKWKHSKDWLYEVTAIAFWITWRIDTRLRLVVRSQDPNISSVAGRAGSDNMAFICCQIWLPCDFPPAIGRTRKPHASSAEAELNLIGFTTRGSHKRTHCPCNKERSEGERKAGHTGIVST